MPIDLGEGGVGGVLGGSVEVAEARDGGDLVDLFGEGAGERLAGEVDGARGGGDDAQAEPLAHGGGDGVEEGDGAPGLEGGDVERVAGEDERSPQVSGAKSSKMERSKQIEVTAKTPWSSSGEKVRCAQWRKTTALRWVMATPLGTPGGAGGIDDVGARLVGAGGWESLVGVGVDERRVGVEQNLARAVTGDAGGEARLRDEERERGVVGDEGEASGGYSGSSGT